jgi:acyl-CoA thioesterase I
MQNDRLSGGRVMLILRTLALIAFALCGSTAYSASKTILVLGDSLSAEYGLARGTGWVTLLEQKLKAEKINASIVNASISGETTSGGRARLHDGLRGLSLASTEANLRTMITASQKAQAKVLLVGMQIPPNYGGDYTRQFAGVFPKLAKQTGAALVPFLLERLADQPQLFQSDRIHPTSEAQPLMLESVWPHLKPLLAK